MVRIEANSGTVLQAGNVANGCSDGSCVGPFLSAGAFDSQLPAARPSVWLGARGRVARLRVIDPEDLTTASFDTGSGLALCVELNHWRPVVRLPPSSSNPPARGQSYSGRFDRRGATV
jgi:hypothetical protein